jgi:O-antigen/teichoic acid export membrane protein
MARTSEDGNGVGAVPGESMAEGGAGRSQREGEAQYRAEVDEPVSPPLPTREGFELSGFELSGFELPGLALAEGQEAPDDGPSAEAIGTTAARGAAGAVARSAFIMVVQTASSILVARELAPEYYGAYALGSTIVGLGRLIGDCGASTAAVQRPGELEVPRPTLRALHWIQIVTTAIATFSIIAMGPLITKVFDGPSDTVPILVAMSLMLLLEAPMVVPRTRLLRSMEFHKLTVITLVSAIVLYAVQIAALLGGMGVWALVVGQFASITVLVIGTLVLGGGTVRPAIAGSWTLAKSGLAYQANLLTPAVTNLIAIAVVGSTAGATVVGFWSWSTVLATPLIQLLYNIRDVGFPALARLHEHHPRRHADATALVARLLSLLLGIGIGVMAAFAVPLIELVFGDQWLPASGAVQVGVVAVLPLGLSWIVATALESRGGANDRLVALVISSVLALAVCAPLTNAWGATGAAFAIFLLVPTVDFGILWVRTRLPLTRAVVEGCVVTAVVAGIGLPLAATTTSFVGLLLWSSFTAMVGVILVMAIDRRAIWIGRDILMGRLSVADA